MRRSLIILVNVCLFAWAASASATTLYDGTLGTVPGNFPPGNDQGWAYGASGAATQTAAGNVTTLDTTAADSISAGYNAHLVGTFMGNPVSYTMPGLPVPFDRTTGYTVEVTAQETSESHSSVNRAGFSIIALSSDLSGIELGFWSNEIWAQSISAGPTYFTHGEGIAYDTTGQHTYDVAILGSQYRLFADGTQILSGSLRDYSGSGVTTTVGTFSTQPYSTPSFIFLGDDTTEANASVNIANVQMFSTALPEPSSFVLLGIGVLVCGGKLCKVRQIKRRFP